MATRRKQLSIDDIVEENIIDGNYVDVMEKSYIDYSMSVITSRAVPDICDGLKPVQRRILYAMGEQGMTHDKPFKKSAKVTGLVLGSYHPHGDSSVYEAAVVMAQGWKKEVSLIDGHGNFGSIEGDGPAAARYTEMRLQEFSEYTFLSELKNNTVDYMPNYDETTKEPVVLPCLVPNFLINGSEGIAVGMTTSTPTHNLKETIDAAILLLDKPKSTVQDLLKVLHGPDFPTGGIVCNEQDLENIYSTGVGKIRVRGVVRLEKGKSSERDKLVITEIPYTMIGDGINKFQQDVAALVEDRTITDIVDIANQSDKNGIRIVLELKKNADVKNLEAILYKKTKLEDTFGVNMLAVHNSRPEVMNLKTALQAFLDFQEDIYTRKYKNILNKSLKRKEVTEGLIRAIDVIDTIVEILRGSRNITQAKECLIHGATDGITFKTKTAAKQAKTLKFSETQAQAILEMRLSRLVGLELTALQKDLSDIEKDIAHCKKIIGSKAELKREIKKTLSDISKKYGRPRRTKIANIDTPVVVKKEEPEVPVVVLVDRFGYIHGVDKTAYDKNPVTDYKYIIETTNRSKIGVFTDTGVMHSIKVKEIPFGKVKDKGQPIDNISNYNSKSENIVGIVNISGKLLFTSTDGFIKVVNSKEFDVTRKTVDSTILNDGEKVLSVAPYVSNGYLILKSKEGFYLRFECSSIPSKKKNSIGVIGLTLAKGDKIEFSTQVSNLSEEIEPNRKASKVKLGKRAQKGIKMRGSNWDVD